MAPEQVVPEETFNPTTQTDIYSFGCVALQGCSFMDSDTRPLLIHIIAGFVWQTAMVGSPGRFGRRVALVAGMQAGPTKVSNVECLTLEFDSRLLVSNGGTPCCGGDNTHH